MVFKKLLLILGLIAVFASVIQQSFDEESSNSLSSAQGIVAQIDKDNQRDIGDKALITVPAYNQFPVKSFVYYFYSASYQEPTLLVHQRPPNA